MEKESLLSPSERNPVRVIPLPVALYESDGLIFELYDGGQPYQPMVISWIRLKPVSVMCKDDGDLNLNEKERSGKTAPREPLKLIDLVKALRESFHHELAAKTGWGREELKTAFERAISNALAQNTTIE